MLFTVLFATLFLVAFVILAGVVMFLSKTIDHGEARFDSETGKTLPGDQATSDASTDIEIDAGPATPAKRIEPTAKDTPTDQSGDA